MEVSHLFDVLFQVSPTYETVIYVKIQYNTKYGQMIAHLQVRNYVQYKQTKPIKPKQIL